MIRKIWFFLYYVDTNMLKNSQAKLLVISYFFPLNFILLEKLNENAELVITQRSSNTAIILVHIICDRLLHGFV